MYMHKTKHFSSGTLRVTIAAENSLTEGGDIAFIHIWVVTCIKMYFYSE